MSGAWAGTERAGGDFGVGAGGDVSRNIDIVAERAVLDCLREAGFGCVVLGEECGRVEIPGDSRGYVIMDAVDGSANAVRGVPFFCSSLAFATGTRLSSVTDGVVTDLATGQAYWASRGRGAFLDGRPIGVRGGPGDPPYRIVGVNTSGATADLMRRLRPIFEGHNHVRHFGANALEMAFLARGLLDAFVDLRGRIRIQDIAAGYVIAQGGRGAGRRRRPRPAGRRPGLRDADLVHRRRKPADAGQRRRADPGVAGARPSRPRRRAPAPPPAGRRAGNIYHN